MRDKSRQQNDVESEREEGFLTKTDLRRMGSKQPPPPTWSRRPPKSQRRRSSDGQTGIHERRKRRISW